MVILIATIGQLFCGMACLTSASRMCYAFSRDRAVPGHRLWTKLNHHRVPAFSVIFMATCALIVTLPALIGDENNYTYAFYAVVSITVIGLYIAYVIPIYLRWRQGRLLRAGAVDARQQVQVDQPARDHLGDHLRDRLQPSADRAAERRGPTTSTGSTSTTRRSRSLVVIIAVGLWWLISARNTFAGPDPADRDRRHRPGRSRTDEDRPSRGRVALPRVTLDELKQAVANGTVDTVLLAIADMEGRLQGKRLTATHFLDEVAENGAEGCNYLLAVDVDMDTVDGYEMASWDRGYGDFEMKPDLDTLRPIPWHEGTVLVIGDLAVGRRPAGRRVAAADPPAPARAARRARPDRERRHRARVHRLQDAVRGGLAERLPRPRAGQPLQRRLLAARHLAGRAADPPDPQRDGRRPGSTSRARRASATSASTRSTSATATRCAPPTSTRSTRTAPRRSPPRRTSRSRSWRSSTSARATAATSTARSPTPRRGKNAFARRPARCSTTSSPARSPACAR